MLIDLYFKGKVHRRAEIDDDCWPLVRGYIWRWSPPSERAKQCEGYATSTAHTDGSGQKRAISLHRMLIGAKPGEVVTFRDRNSLNCKRDNLLIGDQGLATALSGRSDKNRTGFRGVRKKSGGFVAAVTHKKVTYQSRLYATAGGAAAWAKKRRLELHGEAAWDAVPSRHRSTHATKSKS